MVSGLASAFPEAVVAVVREPRQERQDGVEARRAALERFPFQAAAKVALGRRGVPVRPDVRGPLRTLTPNEREELERWLDELS